MAVLGSGSCSKAADADVGRSAPPSASRLNKPERALLESGDWLNSPPLRAEDLRGKVVLVNFWTYSCINSLRPLPYLRAWAEKYRAQGLVVVGVHAPEFAFEKDIANVRRATRSQGVGYPVVLDSDHGIWRAFSNSAWPAFYFIGADGRVRRQVLGEGEYDKSERLIQQLLSDARGAPVQAGAADAHGVGAQAAADFQNLQSPETYIGYARATNFASTGGLKRDGARLYIAPSKLAVNRWGLAGEWRAGSEFATLIGGTGSVAYRFHARDLHMVLAPTVPGQSIRFRITIDGLAPGANHGADVEPGGAGRIDAPRMYQLVRQRQTIADRTFQIEFLDPGLRAYVFTFG
jgi:thiol-disulfide isomerase/thioredoxin